MYILTVCVLQYVTRFIYYILKGHNVNIKWTTFISLV